MPGDARHAHGSGVVQAEGYQPGAKEVYPYGRSAGVQAVPATVIPSQPVESRRTKARIEAETERYHNPPKRGRRVGSKNRPPLTQDMLDGPPDQD